MILDTNAISALLVGDRALGAVLEANPRHHLPEHRGKRIMIVRL